MTSLANRIEAMEQQVIKAGLSCSVPGTMLTRQLCDVRILEMEGIKLPPTDRPRESAVVWCLCLGGMGDPKMFFRGLTVLEAVKRAERGVKLYLEPPSRKAKNKVKR